MQKIIVEMTNREYRRFESYKQAEKIVRSIKRSLKDVALSNTGTKKLKSARELINEIWSYCWVWKIAQAIIKKI